MLLDTLLRRYSARLSSEDYFSIQLMRQMQCKRLLLVIVYPSLMRSLRLQKFRVLAVHRVFHIVFHVLEFLLNTVVYIRLVPSVFSLVCVKTVLTWIWQMQYQVGWNPLNILVIQSWLGSFFYGFLI